MGLARNTQSDEKKECTTRLPYTAKLSFRVEGQTYKVLPRPEKAKGVHQHQTTITWNVEGSSLRRRKKKIKIWTIKWQ